MGMSIDDIIQGLKETYMICCSVFAYDRKKYIDGAIDRLSKYQIMKADYENRLKADLVAMLTELSMKIGEIEDGYVEFDEENKRSLTMIPLESVERLIDRKINSLKEA